MSTHKEGTEYDIIFAGGGTAACIVAGRLAKADPSLSILLIEHGKNNLNDPNVVNSSRYLYHLAPNTQTAIIYKGNKTDDLNGREPIVTAGGILGGGSSINFAMYTRASGVDYDSWNTEGWDAKSMLHFAKKLETYHLDDPAVDQSVHGHDGPIHVSFGAYSAKDAQDDILAGAAAVGIPEIIDLQDFKAVHGFSRWLRYNSPDGKRQDTAHRYVHPLMASGKYPNLHLLVQSTVSRVIFEGNRAVGVEYLPNAAFQPITNLTHRDPSIIKAKKLVVVSAGALGTPQILERSGVGNPELLKKLDIPVVADVPGVGEEYQDHNLIFYSYKTSLKPDQTLDDMYRGNLDFYEAVEKKNPIVTWNAVDLAAKLRPTDDEVAQLDQEFQDHWNRDFKDQPTRPLMLLAVVSSFLGDHKTLPEEQTGPSQYLSIGMYTGYPYSRGDIHITSKDVDAAPCFNAGFLSKSVDLTKQIWAYKKQREIFRRTNVMTSELPIGSPKFREGSKAALRKQPEAQGGFKTLEERKALPPIEYDEEDDKAIEEYIRSNIETTWHSLGTCKMAPKEKGGVVDKHLNVYGTVGLKICDLSIAPENVGANTNNTALIVGEKGADIIAKELGLVV
ncbi:alcohol oxidase [Trichoderma longibrachiatum]|uniref:GMC oxidoreductase n=1 Tax=Trichoderma longibrachiatum ATCC 18648 TaxID=983965 RepID=A0A2T4C6A0_TRILO|nr:GMC oxidoreductase [Trichoderma longibrachiatum ATCC 18648]